MKMNASPGIYRLQQFLIFNILTILDEELLATND